MKRAAVARSLVWSVPALMWLATGCETAASFEAPGEDGHDVPGPGAAGPEKLFHDPETGQTYTLNPNRRAMGHALPENARALTQGFSYSMVDWSGTIETRVWECVEYTRQSIQSGIACQVDPDYVLVGGGAWAHYFASGALLTESRPSDRGLVTWLASSKDHLSPDPHELHVYAIGLKVSGLTRDALMTNIVFVQSDPSAIAAHPTQSVSLPSGYRMLGAGAKINWTAPGNLLTSTTSPSSCCPITTWQVAGKDHLSSSPATIVAYAIGIKASIAGYGSFDFTNGGYPPSAQLCGYGVLQAPEARPAGWVYTGLGGNSTWSSGPGRMLFRVGPDPNDPNKIIVASKDHLQASWGCLTTDFLLMRKLP